MTIKQNNLLKEKAFLYARHQKQPRAEISFRGWQHRWALAGAIILSVFIMGAGTTAAATQALPDEPLYPVKLATEQVKMTLAFSDIQKTKLQVQFAERRALEIAEMARQGKPAHIIEKTVEQLITQLDKTNYYTTGVIPEKLKIKVAPPPLTLEERTVEQLITQLDKTNYYTTGVIPERLEIKIAPVAPKALTPALTLPLEQATELKKLLEKGASQNLAVLEQALKQAPEQAKPALRHAIEMQKKKYQKILERLEEKAPPKPPHKP